MHWVHKGLKLRRGEYKMEESKKRGSTKERNVRRGGVQWTEM